MRSVVIFGGTGFIGTHLTQHLLADDSADRIWLVDIQPPRNEEYAIALNRALSAGRVRFVQHDLRQPLPDGLIDCEPELIFNLAAIHREPGHHSSEYFETNLQGGHNVCAWAAKTGCPTIVFTSSISPYGPSSTLKTEETPPAPETPYGRSKLSAEKLHKEWQANGEGRTLLIVRPGVVFGPGEGGNVSRLIKALVKGYFFYMGNKETRKAAIYVKELCRAISFLMEQQKEKHLPVLTANLSMNPPPTLESMVDAIRKVTRHRTPVFSVPRAVLMGVAYPIEFLAKLFGIRQPISPVRVRKTFRSTNVVPGVLNGLQYCYHYSLQSAFEDWKGDSPKDFS